MVLALALLGIKGTTVVNSVVHDFMGMVVPKLVIVSTVTVIILQDTAGVMPVLKDQTATRVSIYFLTLCLCLLLINVCRL